MSSYRYDVGYQIRLEKLVMKAFMLVFLVVVPVHAAKLDCVIEASEEANVSSSVRGVMSVVEVKRGDWVEKGQVLALIESSVEQASVDLARARAETDKLVQARKARLNLANKRLERVRDLMKNKAISTQDVDEAETEQALAVIELEQARDDRRIAKLELARAEKMLALRTIHSPISGVVVEVYTSAGELVEDSPIMRIAQIDPLFVQAIAPVEAYGSIKRGDLFQVVPEEPIGGRFDAEVSMVEGIIDARSGTFGIQLVLENRDRALPAGLRCKLSSE
jgi:RND family efflux transporter MFP subunit